MKILGIIPARYGSSRFMGKVLADIAGKSMIERVYGQALKAQSLAAVLVATDDERVMAHVEAFGGRCVMTSPEHPSGTDRCQEAYLRSEIAADFVLNIQGDEPFIAPSQIDLLAACLQAETEVATLVGLIREMRQLTDPSEAKVVLNAQQEALYFSRSPIPFVRDLPLESWLGQTPFYRHIGLYAYRVDVLAQLSQLPPSPLEKAESLEQLRWLEAGYRIKVALTEQESLCVETPEDLQRAIALARQLEK